MDRTSQWRGWLVEELGDGEASERGHVGGGGEQQ